MTIVCIPFPNNDGKSFTGIIFLEKKTNAILSTEWMFSNRY